MSGHAGPSRCAAIAGAVIAIVATRPVDAHSASDAYLSLVSEHDAGAAGTRPTIIHGQWDIALRDLDFVAGLDGDGDGAITWRELRSRWQAIERYAFSKISFEADAMACAVRPTKRLVTEHADGTYVALFFDVVCRPGARRYAVDYQLFFAIDPSHRAIVIWRSADGVATALLSPTRTGISVAASVR